jgi:hypothetical protein
MNRFKSYTLTDVASDVWLDSFTVGNEQLRLGTPHDWSIRKRTLRGGARDGVDLIEVHNGALSYSILPTRGMGLWRGEYRGNFLGWKSPVLGPVHPKLVQFTDRGGLGWLTGFDEWMCRCGLSWFGPPGEDVITDKNGKTSKTPLTLHGRIANIPAHLVEVRVNLDPPHELSVIGQVFETGLFHPHLHLTTIYTTIPGSHRVTIHDVVENRSATATEIEVLYHTNVGAPFLEGGSRFVAPIKEMAPLTARAAEGIDTYDTYLGPTAGYTEQVYCYELLADAAGKSLAMLYNRAADRGMALRFSTRELPCFTLWKNTQALEDGYCTGLEPGTNFPNLKTIERQKSRIRTLPPGGKWEAGWSIEILDTQAGVGDVLKEIVTLQSHAKAMIHKTPNAKFGPA